MFRHVMRRLFCGAGSETLITLPSAPYGCLALHDRQDVIGNAGHLGAALDRLAGAETHEMHIDSGLAGPFPTGLS